MKLRKPFEKPAVPSPPEITPPSNGNSDREITAGFLTRLKKHGLLSRIKGLPPKDELNTESLFDQPDAPEKIEHQLEQIRITEMISKIEEQLKIMMLINADNRSGPVSEERIGFSMRLAGNQLPDSLKKFISGSSGQSLRAHYVLSNERALISLIGEHERITVKIPNLKNSGDKNQHIDVIRVSKEPAEKQTDPIDSIQLTQDILGFLDPVIESCTPDHIKQLIALRKRHPDNPLFSNNLSEVPRNYLTVYCRVPEDKLDAIGQEGLKPIPGKPEQIPGISSERTKFKFDEEIEALIPEDVRQKYPDLSRHDSVFAFPDFDSCVDPAKLMGQGDIILEVRIPREKVYIADADNISRIYDGDDPDSHTYDYWRSAMRYSEYSLLREEETCYVNPEILIPGGVNPQDMRVFAIHRNPKEESWKTS
ncbi:MAG: hypothetical protein UV73_C0007G0055 [Candidatus Gottesmanbacteria bacterium GW2011_GWA2_43_14]|uniref:Uncharacterized protein n=1 Tax=Candidatus Gottesmanbacteria bacterium GW2011_GWA2_43_14 TaxID=1618443 RepID=A0A0G1DJ64_9BACT|nr:MAG: hypothetical protein UV73_C0007G0055 [Candidatus Gottesmanbacteria bacterium GW2011_GWA2_43_14]